MMEIIIKSPLYNKIIYEEEEGEHPVDVGPELADSINNIVNPPSDEEAEKINQVASLINQTQPEEEVPEEEDEREDPYISIKQVEIGKMMLKLKTELVRNEKNIKDTEEFNNTLYTIDSIIDNFELYSYEDQLQLIELIIQKMKKIK